MDWLKSHGITLTAAPKIIKAGKAWLILNWLINAAWVSSLQTRTRETVAYIYTAHALMATAIN